MVVGMLLDPAVQGLVNVSNQDLSMHPSMLRDAGMSGSQAMQPGEAHMRCMSVSRAGWLTQDGSLSAKASCTSLLVMHNIQLASFGSSSLHTNNASTLHGSNLPCGLQAIDALVT